MSHDNGYNERGGNGKTPMESASKVVIDPDHPHAGNGGVLPPKHSQFKPGNQFSKGKGRNAGRTVARYLNAMGDLTMEQIRSIAKAPNTSAAKKLAAIIWLEALEAPDMADYEDVVMRGGTLKSMREAGLDTSHVKSLRHTEPGEKSGGSTALELRNETRHARNEILDRTNGKPRQAVEIEQAAAVGVRVQLMTREDMDKVVHLDEPPPEELLENQSQ